MITIKVPNNNIFERKYIINIIFKEMLGIMTEVIFDNNIDNYEITLNNNNQLIIRDFFFNIHKKAKSSFWKVSVNNFYDIIQISRFLP